MQPHSSHRGADQHDEIDIAGFRDRLVRFYNLYDPTKLIVVDGMVQDALGSEDQLFEALVRVYGPEPNVKKQSTRSGPENEKMRERLHRFYSTYNPSKIPDIAEVMVTFEDREAELFKALVNKYGPEPPPRPDQSQASQAQEPTEAPNEVVSLVNSSKQYRQARYGTAVAMLTQKHESHVRRKYYYRWLESIWWGKNRTVLEKVIDDGKSGILVEKQANQQLREQIEYLREKLRIEKEVKEQQLQSHRADMAVALQHNIIHEQQAAPVVHEIASVEEVPFENEIPRKQSSFRLPMKIPDDARSEAVRRQSLKSFYSSVQQPLQITTTESVGCGPSPSVSPTLSPRLKHRDSVLSADRSILIDTILAHPAIQNSEELQQELNKHVPVPDIETVQRSTRQSSDGIHIHLDGVGYKQKRKSKKKKLSENKKHMLVDELVANITGMAQMVSYPSPQYYYPQPQMMSSYSTSSYPIQPDYYYHSVREKQRKKRSASRRRGTSGHQRSKVINYTEL